MKTTLFILFFAGMLVSGCSRCNHASAEPPDSAEEIRDLQGQVIGIIQYDDPDMLHVTLLVPTADESKFDVFLSADVTPDKIIAVSREKPMKTNQEALGIVNSENYAHIMVEIKNQTGENAVSMPSEPTSSLFGDVSAPDKFAVTVPGRYLLTFTKVNGGPPVAIFKFGIIDDNRGLAGGFYFTNTTSDQRSN